MKGVLENWMRLSEQVRCSLTEKWKGEWQRKIQSIDIKCQSRDLMILIK